jgi:hypothetical protein
LNWDALGAIGEVIGAGAVLVTLLFLITQLRQNTKSLDESKRATISQLYQFRAQMHMDGMLRKAETSDLSLFDVNPRMREIGFEALTEAEQMFLVFHATADAVRLDNGLLQHQNGFLDDDYVAYIENSIRVLEPYWNEIGLFERGSFRPGFITEVSRIRETTKSDGAEQRQ